MKRMLQLFVCLLMLSSSLCGCLPYQPLTETAIVEAIGIDFDEEEEEYHLTLQLYLPQSNGADSNVIVGQENTVLLQSKGKTIDEAVKQANLQQGKNVDLGFSQALVLGPTAIQYRLKEIIYYFDNNQDVRWTMQIVMAAGKASDIVSVPLKQGISEGAQISELLSGQIGSGWINAKNYFEFSRAIANHDGCTTLPTLSVQAPDNSDTEKIPSLTLISAQSSAVIDHWKLSSFLTPEETRGVLVLSNKLKDREENLLVESGEITVNVSKCQTSMELNEKDLTITAKIDAEPATLAKSEEWMEELSETIRKEMKEAYLTLRKLSDDPSLFLDNHELDAFPEEEIETVTFIVTVHEKKA